MQIDDTTWQPLKSYKTLYNLKNTQSAQDAK